MKVQYILNNFLPQQIAGTEVYTWALGKQLQQNLIDVEIIIPAYNKNESHYYEFDKLKVFCFAEPSIVDRALILGLTKPDGLKEFESHIKNELPDIVHFHELAGSNGITLHHILAAKQAGAKVIMTFHLAKYTCKTGTLMYMGKSLCNGKIDIKKCSRCYLHSKKNGIVLNLLLQVSLMLYKLGINTTKLNNKIGTALATPFLIKNLKVNFETLIARCDKVIVISNWYNKILLLNGVPKTKIRFIPQGLPIPITVNLPSIDRKVSQPIRLIFLGRINPFKGLHLLLDALQDISEDLICLDIYGHCDDEKYEQNWRAKTVLKKNIKWKGTLAQANVLNTMINYDVLCLCSTFSEMSPLVIQEAFTARLPVIASDVYGNAEQITNGENGWLFKFNNSSDLKNKLQQIIAYPAMITKARNQIKPARNFSTVAEENISLYNEVLYTE